MFEHVFIPPAIMMHFTSFLSESAPQPESRNLAKVPSDSDKTNMQTIWILTTPISHYVTVESRKSSLRLA